MPKTRPPYAPEFRRQLVELVRAGRDPADLAREFEPSAQAIRNWVAQADRQEGRREAKLAAADTALVSAERDEVRQPAWSGSIRFAAQTCQKPRPDSPAKPARYRPGLRVHEREPGLLPRFHHGARALRVEGRLLRLAAPPSVGPCRGGCGVAEADRDGARQLSADLRSTAGARRTQAGAEKHGRKRVARLMHEADLAGACHRRGGPVTTRRDKESRPAPDLVDRDFTAAGPNQLWFRTSPTPTATRFL